MARANLEKLEIRREFLCKNFAEKCLKNDKVKDIFKPRIKNHIMKTREEEIFDVKFAHTERLKKSTIPYIQRMLNRDKTQKRKSVELESEKNVKRIRKPGQFFILNICPSIHFCTSERLFIHCIVFATSL